MVKLTNRHAVYPNEKQKTKPKQKKKVRSDSEQPECKSFSSRRFWRKKEEKKKEFMFSGLQINSKYGYYTTLPIVLHSDTLLYTTVKARQ